MPGNDERDSLDDWLDREVRPLPPPSGTFEMITKRARRRKARKLAISVTSAAAVAAAVVVAVPTVLNLHLSTSSTTGVTAGHTFTPSATAPSPNALTSTPAMAAPTSPMGSQSPAPTTSVGVAPSIAMPPGGPVPPNFQPTSVTFVSASEGWAIGQAGTPGKCANADPTICTSMVRTNDRGRTWVGVPAPSTSRVGSIRFLDGINGWAFGPDLWSTHDRGNTWTQVDTGGQQVASLETSGDKAFAVFTACKVVNTQICTATLESSPASADAWSPVGPATTGLKFPAGGGMWSAVVTLGGGRGWLVGPAGALYSGLTDGGPWQPAGTSPCGMQTLLGWVKSTGVLASACGSQSGTAQQPTATSTVYTSGDLGQTWSPGATKPSTGVVESFSASPSAPYILATSAGIDVRTSAGAENQVVSLAKGFAYVGMTGNNQGVAIPANPLLHEIFMTYDGGLTWTPVTIVP